MLFRAGACGHVAVQVVAALAVALCAVLGGGFEPSARLWLGALLAVVAASLPLVVGDRLRSWETVFLAFILWAGALVLGMRVALLAGKETVTVWLAAWCLWVVASRADPAARRAVLVVLIGAGCVVSVGVWLEFLVFGMLRVGGLLENPNVAASLLVPTMAAAYGLYAERPLRCAIVMIVLGSGLAMTGSRAGVVAAGVAVVAALSGLRYRVLASLGAVAMGGALMAWRLATVPDSLAWHRLAIWRAVWKLWFSRPLTGVSPGTLPDAAGGVRIAHPDSLGIHQHVIAYAESTPLGLLAQTGAVGLVLVLVGVVLWLLAAWRHGAMRSPAVRALLASVVVFLALHDQLQVDVTLWWWALLVGVVVRPTGKTGECVSTGSRAGRVLAALGLSGFVLWGIVQPAYARWRWSVGARDVVAVERALRAEPWLSTAAESRTLDLLGQGDWTWEVAAQALYWSERAVMLRPGQARLWADLARVHVRVLKEVGSLEESAAEARHAYERACALEPRLPWYWAELALLERDLGNVERARALIMRALDAEPHFVRARLLLARLELDLGRVEAARDALGTAEESVAAARGRLLSGYERDLVRSPQWQWDSLREALP